MRQRSSGFTLIELITVIVILGILAAVAVPRFIDLQSDAKEAGVQGVAGNLASASSVNLAGALANNSDATAFTNCSQAADLIQGGIPSGYVINTGNGPTTLSQTGAEFSCVVAATEGSFSQSFPAFVVPSNP